MTYNFFLPRNTINVWKKEVDRSLVLFPKHAEYYSWKMPFKGDICEFNEKLYQPYPGVQPAGDMAAYSSG